MAATTITDIVVRESGRYLENQIGERTFEVSPWMTVMPRDVFPGGYGETLNTLMYERTAPVDTTSQWTQVKVVDGQEGGACLPPVRNIGIGSTTRSFSLFATAIEGPDFCAEEFRSAFALKAQLDKITNILAGYTRLEWDIQDRREYFKNCLYKVNVDAAGGATSTSTMASAYGTSDSVYRLVQGLLDKWRLKLIRDGAAMGAFGRENGSPILTLMCSAETSEHLLKDVADIRSDVRYAKPNELLAPLGVERSFKGFYHLIDPYPRRFSFSGGVYTEIPPFASSAASKGNKYEINSTWESATYEESFIFSPSVMTQLVPEPVVAPAKNFKFDPQNYVGTWKVQNIKDRDTNPDGTILHHRGVLAAASMPNQPEHGVAFIHRRCDPSIVSTNACV